MIIIIALLFLQPPPPTPTPIIVGDPCLNMTPPIEGAQLPTDWILPDGTDCTPEDEITITPDARQLPPPPVVRAPDMVYRILNMLNRIYRP